MRRVHIMAALAAAGILALGLTATGLWFLLRPANIEVRVDARGDGARILFVGSEAPEDLEVGANLAKLSRSLAAPRPLDVTRVLVPAGEFASTVEHRRVLDLLAEKWDAVVLAPTAEEILSDNAGFAAAMARAEHAAAASPRATVIVLPFAPRTGPLVDAVADAAKEAGGMDARTLLAARLTGKVVEQALKRSFRVAPGGAYGFSADRTIFFAGRALHDDTAVLTDRGAYFLAWTVYWSLVGQQSVRPDSKWWAPKSIPGSDANELRHYGWRLSELASLDAARAKAEAEAAAAEAAAGEGAEPEADAAKQEPAKKKSRRKRRPKKIRRR